MSVWCNLWACEEVRLIINLLHPTLIRQHKKVLAARCTLWTFFMVWLNSRLSTAQQVRFWCTIFSVLQLISSNALIWTRPDHFGGVGWNRFLAVLSIWFHMLWTTSILSRPVGLSRKERKRGRVETQSQRVPSYSFSFSSHLALSGLLPWLPCLCLTLVAWPVPGSHLRTRVSQIPTGAYCPPTPSNQISPGKQEEFCSIQIRYQAWTNLATKSAQRAVL